MSQTIVLYDIPSKSHTCWSLNPWKTRAALNFKGLGYATDWTEYPDLEPKFKSFGITPNPEGTPASYSSPAARMPDGSYIMDSRKIADSLEQFRPEPSLRLDSGYVDKVQNIVLDLWKALAPIAMPRIPSTFLLSASAEYFERTREKRFGMPLNELAKSDKAGETAWTIARPAVLEMSEVLLKHRGAYILGEDASYADLVFAGFWHMMTKLSEDGDLVQRLSKDSKSDVFGSHFAACGRWFEKDD